MRVLAFRLCVLASVAALVFSPAAASRARAMPAPSTRTSPGAPDRASTLSSSVVVFGDQAQIAAAETGDSAAVVAGRYIVTFRAGVADPLATTLALAGRLGFRPTHVYRARIRGFAARLSVDAVASLRRDPNVSAVYADGLFHHTAVMDNVYRVGGFRNATAKIDGRDERVNADVAVVDGGIIHHLDLNVAGGFDCTGNADPYHDDDGHGTHVAGIVGALDNGIGSVGIAPGARIYPVRVFVFDSATTAALICAMETIADNAGLFEVANMSFRYPGADGPCSSDPFHQAVCDAFNAGVTLVAAAGNDVDDARNWIPAAYSQVITVSAFADSDGRPGGLGPPTSRGADDAFATFSNYGPKIDIAAPGVEVVSTWPNYLQSKLSDPNYNYLSGTSMAAPAVTAAIALLMTRQGRLSPAEAKRRLLAAAIPAVLPGDPDGSHEPLLNVGDYTPTLTLKRTSGKYKTTVAANLTGFHPNANVALQWDAGPAARQLMTFNVDGTGAATVSFSVPATPRGRHTVVAPGGPARHGHRPVHRDPLHPRLPVLRTARVSGLRLVARLRGRQDDRRPLVRRCHPAHARHREHERLGQRQGQRHDPFRCRPRLLPNHRQRARRQRQGDRRFPGDRSDLWPGRGRQPGLLPHAFPHPDGDSGNLLLDDPDVHPDHNAIRHSDRHTRPDHRTHADAGAERDADTGADGRRVRGQRSAVSDVPDSLVGAVPPNHTPADPNKVIQGLWIGDELSVMEQLSISSFLLNGHHYHLYVYDDIRNVPMGTVLRDATEILPASRIFRYADSPTFAGFANFFRYKLLLERGGWWADCDIVCLRPLEFPGEHVFATEFAGTEDLAANCIIKAPIGSRAMAFAWDVCQSKRPDVLVWGEIGPALVRRAIAELSLEGGRLPSHVFCPLAYWTWKRAVEPGSQALLNRRSFTVHLWHEMWRLERRDTNARYPPTSLYEHLKTRYLRLPCYG